MSSLLSMLGDSLAGRNLASISQAIGADEASTQNAIGAALPALVGALSKNGASPEGAQSILNALTNDAHDGGVLDDLPGFVQSRAYEQPRSGDGILKHLLGEKRNRVEKSVSNASGITSENASHLIKLLAPIVLGALGKQRKEQSFDIGSLSGFLGNERDSVDEQSGGLIGRLLDQDGDGDFDLHDVAKAAMSKFFG